MILVLIYILTIFFARDYFSIKELGLFFTALGTLWLLSQIKNFSLKTTFQPLILIVIGIISIQQNDFIVLKSFPLILSLFFFFSFVYAEINKEYFILNFIRKIKSIDEKEEIYLKKTHSIWIVVTFINGLLHGYFLFYASIEQWTFYSTIGWYILLACGILFQVIFRRFYEKKAN